MEDITANTTNQEVIGGRVCVIEALLEVVEKCIVKPMEVFERQICLAQESHRIKKATLKPQLHTTAARIAATVNAERPATPATLRGLVREETESNTSQLEREVQSLKAQMANLMKPGAKTKKKPPNQSTNYTKKRQIKKTRMVSTVAKPAPKRIKLPVPKPQAPPALQPPPQKARSATHREANQMGKGPPPTRKSAANCRN